MRAPDGGFGVATIPGVAALWRETRGDPRVSIAVLDGPADLAHPALAGASVVTLDSPAVPGADFGGAALEHGTHVASLIFGQGVGPVAGLAPRCRGLLIPVFGRGPTPECSELDLARAIFLAIEAGAHIINISAGRPVATGSPHPLLARALETCEARRVLVVAASGNDGDDRPHLPAAWPTVLVAGAMDGRGEPLATNNRAASYRGHSLLAPGVDLPGARPGGGFALASGSSPAAAVTAGVAGLLLSRERSRGERPDAVRIRKLLLDTVDLGTDDRRGCGRSRSGRLSISRAMAALDLRESGKVDEPDHDARVNTAPDSVATEAIRPTATGCGCAACSGRGAPGTLIFALGSLGHDVVSEARRDSLRHEMDASPDDPGALLEYLDRNPWEAASVTWTLQLDQTPIYSIRPEGPFAAEAYARLREFYRDQAAGRVERVSIPGVLAGHDRLMTGQVVPAVVPELRGMSSWTTSALVEAVAGKPPREAAAQEEHRKKSDGVRSFLDRVYYELRNLGITSEERAMNFAATNAFHLESVYESAIKQAMELDSVVVERSPICRPDSDCWDVRLLFFYPDRPVLSLRRAYRFTVDVSDVVPVLVGPVRSWTIR